MTIIGLVRHGITDWNSEGRAQGVSDIPLNEEGREQATSLAHRLTKDTWDVMVTSDLSRAKETGKIINATLEIPVIIDKRIREINCGKMEGTTENERIKLWGSDWRKVDLGMESFDDVSKRGIDFLQEISTKHANKKILVISHGALLGLTLKRLLPHVFKETHLDNTSITTIKNHRGKWECTLYNCTAHLESVTSN